MKVNNNKSGIVLFMVLMTSIIIMILSVGIFTQSMNEINFAQSKIDQITSEQLTKGIFWQNYASEMTALPTAAVVDPSPRAYSTTITTSSAGGITTYTAQTTYTLPQ